MVLKTFKKGRRIICYILKDGSCFRAMTGKPSDASCIGWTYDNYSDAEKTAKEYFENYTNCF